ncbi:MAG TPA: DUF763 domain-containing protein [Gammaproteobacteria bacterium]|nr:DUF763 domain-containing protein [Gammaproteobacteria bacterium]
MRTGYAQLPLHGGKAPRWLFQRMVRLAREITVHVVSEYGSHEMLARLSDPYWFQAFGCVLGFDWHSSGVTTTTCGAVKEGLRGLEDGLGLYAAGGKGAASRRTPAEIEQACRALGCDASPLVRASRLSAKVDNSAVQDGHQLYHHCFFFTRDGRWCVVQQGMDDARGTARRYHWLGERVADFVEEPHAAICSQRPAATLNLVDRESRAARQAMTELARQPDREVLRTLVRLPELRLPARHRLLAADVNPRHLQRILLKTYEQAPRDFSALLGIPGVGAKTLRALALVAELIYGTPASCRDPARFAFAHGGKDGTPFPVDRETYDRTIGILHDALHGAALEKADKRRALRRLADFARPGRTIS